MNAPELPSDQPGPSVLAAVFAHHTWASLKLLDFCAGLPEEQLAASTVGGYGAIRDTLQHLVQAEQRYASRASGHQPPHPLPEDAFPGFDMLRAAARWAGAELLAVALAAHADTLVTVQRPKFVEVYPLADLVAQALSHATEHRTQVLSVITTLGLEPPDLSGWAWMEERGTLKVAERTALE